MQTNEQLQERDKTDVRFACNIYLTAKNLGHWLTLALTVGGKSEYIIVINVGNVMVIKIIKNIYLYILFIPVFTL